MAYGRILSVQDISCVGQCSLTVALPVLSVCGHETCVLPTELLSTHTGLPGAQLHHLGRETLERFADHWQRLGITFDAVCTGYLGSADAVDAVLSLTGRLLKPEGLLIVDPAMGDHGRLYSGLGEDYAEKMKELVRRADILIPNLTEAALLTGTPWQERWSRQQVRAMLEKLLKLGCKAAMITGFGEEENTGFLALDREGRELSYSHPLLPRSYPGTGDVFSSVLVGGLVRGLSLREAGVLASDFVAGCIAATAADPQGPDYGVEFESQLGKLMV